MAILARNKPVLIKNGRIWWGRGDLNARPYPEDGVHPSSTGFLSVLRKIIILQVGVCIPVASIMLLEPVVIPF